MACRSLAYPGASQVKRRENSGNMTMTGTGSTKIDSRANTQTTVRSFATALLIGTAMAFPAVSAQAQSADSPVAEVVAEAEAEAVTPQDEAQDAAQAEAPDQPEAPEAPDISIPGGGNTIVVTGRRRQDITRSSTQVVSVLSAEEIARTGEGDIAGALGRVTGLSVQGQGFVFVRGLGDRYSLALLNGLPLPSPQPLSRVVPLDIFPTDVIASSLVQKTYSPNFPGEFGGGVINLTTRAIPDEPFFKISASLSGDTETTFGNGLDYYGSDYDWFGFDDGTRDIPGNLQAFLSSGARISDLTQDQQEAIVQEFGNPNLVLLQRVGDLPANWSAGITAGTAFDVFSDGQLGVIANLSISNSWRNRNVVSQSAINNELQLDTDFRTNITDNRILVNGLLGFGLEVADHKFRWTNLFIRDTQKQSRLAIGDDFQDDTTSTIQDTAFFERQLIDTQLVAEMKFGELGIDLRGGFAQTDREAPYEYTFEYVRTNVENDPFGDQFINVLDRQRGSASVTFSDLNEELWFGGIDFSYPVADWLRATIGYAYTDTDRVSSRRQFLLNAPTSFPDAVGALRPDLLLGDAIIDFFDIGVVESTQADPAFAAALEVQGTYGQLRFTPLDTGITLDIGVRYEDATQTVDPIEVFATPTVGSTNTFIENDYFLPALTLTWEASDALQLRLAASRTIARPQFRELIFQTYFDPETNRQFNGNPLLTDSELLNLEARAEYYLGGSNRLSLAGFYKKIDNPIEVFSTFSDNEQISGFANAPSATLYGAELEAQYNVDLFGLGESFTDKQLVLVGNYTFTQSDIAVGPDDTTAVFGFGGATAATDFFIDGRPLTGQSDHLVNAQISFDDTDRLEQYTLLVTYASERVTSRGTSTLPDIVEDPGLRLDFVARREVSLGGRPLELKFEARNLTGRDNFEFQENEFGRIEINSYAVGRSFSFSVSSEF